MSMKSLKVLGAVFIGVFAMSDFSNVAKADDLGTSSSEIESSDSSIAAWRRPGRGFGRGRGWGGGRRAYFVCTTRNARGQTYRGDGINQFQARNEANRYCRSRSLICINTGCRRVR